MDADCLIKSLSSTTKEDAALLINSNKGMTCRMQQQSIAAHSGVLWLVSVIANTNEQADLDFFGQYTCCDQDAAQSLDWSR